MRAITFESYGSPDDVLHLEHIEPPEPRDGEVLVRVRAAAVNAADWHIIRALPAMARLQFGLRKPRLRVPGSDFAGTVLAAGSHVAGFRVGDDVYGTTFMHGFGALAERVAVGEHLVARKPSNLTFEEAAAVPLAASTALQALRGHGRVGPGDKVLVVGASGGVGTFAVQVAVALGAEVTSVCSTGNHELVRSLGATRVVDYATEDVTTSGERYDLILQLAGSERASAFRRVLAADGTLIQVSGDSANRVVGPLGRIVAGRLLSPFIPGTITSFTVAPSSADLEALTALVEDGKVRPIVERVYSLSEVVDAVRHVEHGHARGKVVVAVDPLPPARSA